MESVITALQQFQATDDDSINVQRLREIFDGFRENQGRECVIPHMFSVLERFPEADLGSPGPLVHELEAIPGYERELKNSLARKPTDLTVWMANRILNAAATQEMRSAWLNELRLALRHPLATASARESAQEFLEYQAGVNA
jgi:hypothetical protein